MSETNEALSAAGLKVEANQNVRHMVEVLIEDLKKSRLPPEPTRSLRQIVGYGTDAGRSRDHNEDFVGKYALGMQQTPEEPDIGLYLVADGMGGHQSGRAISALGFVYCFQFYR